METWCASTQRDGAKQNRAVTAVNMPDRKCASTQRDGAKRNRAVTAVCNCLIGGSMLTIMDNGG